MSRVLIVTDMRAANKVNEVTDTENAAGRHNMLVISDLLLGLVPSMLWSIEEISEASRQSITC